MPDAKNQLCIQVNSCFFPDNVFTPPDTRTDQSGSGNIAGGNSLDGYLILPSSPARAKDYAPAGLTGQNRLQGMKRPLRHWCLAERPGQRLQGFPKKKKTWSRWGRRGRLTEPAAAEASCAPRWGLLRHSAGAQCH